MDVVNVTTGGRIETYVIEVPKDSGAICLNGAAAHFFKKGDLAIVMGYEQVCVSELSGRISRAVLSAEAVRVTRVPCV